MSSVLRTDPSIGLAKETIRKHFTNKIGEPIKTPYYQTQLEIFYENEYFPWVIGNALRELVDENFLVLIQGKDIPHFNSLRYITTINFFVNKNAITTFEDETRIKARCLNIAKLVDNYSSIENSTVLGKHLESLVKAELKAQQFRIVGISTNEYNGKKWTRTNHNLDFIAKHTIENFTIGVEVKNTLNVMDPKEIDIKIDICNELGIIPVFAVRWMRPYTECIRLQGGFSWVFKTQMYPLGYETMTKELFQKLSNEEKTNTKGHPLQFPITVRTELPEKSVKKFEEWLNKIKTQLPSIDNLYRCKDHKRETVLEEN